MPSFHLPLPLLLALLFPLSLALHEGAHAVAVLLCGWRVERLTLVSCAHSSPVSPAPSDLLRNAAICLAGPLATVSLVLCGSGPLAWLNAALLIGCVSDVRMAHLSLQGYTHWRDAIAAQR